MSLSATKKEDNSNIRRSRTNVVYLLLSSFVFFYLLRYRHKETLVGLRVLRSQ